MNFGFNDEQELLRNTARKFFENECGSDTVRRLMETPEGISPELWKKIAEQGWLGLIYPESCHGMGPGVGDRAGLMAGMAAAGARRAHGGDGPRGGAGTVLLLGAPGRPRHPGGGPRSAEEGMAAADRGRRQARGARPGGGPR